MSTDCVSVLAPIVVSDITVKTPISIGDIYVGAPITLNATLGRAGMWTGNGPPGTIVGAVIGDEYLDVISGTIYRLDPGA